MHSRKRETFYDTRLQIHDDMDGVSKQEQMMYFPRSGSRSEVTSDPPLTSPATHWGQLLQGRGPRKEARGGEGRNDPWKGIRENRKAEWDQITTLDGGGRTVSS